MCHCRMCPCRHILQKVSVRNLSSPSLLIPSPLSQINMTGMTLFLIFLRRGNDGNSGSVLHGCMLIHFAFSVTGVDDSRYKVMENQEQVSRRFVVDGAISLHLWAHYFFSSEYLECNSCQDMGFITIWLANFRVKCLVFLKQWDLKPFDEETEKNMQKISTIVHIWLKIKKERTSEMEIIWIFFIW